jgi:glycosyltransferase involved in cell wall biosynthesis
MGRTLNVCKVWDADYPWDVRVEKVASTLTSSGCAVHLAARNKGRLPIREERSEATVHRLPSWRWVPHAVDKASTFPAFVNPRWLRHIWSVARRSRADVILCRDLPLAPACIVVARALGIPVVLDMAENYPAMLESMRSTGRGGPLDAVVRNPRFARWVERWTLKRVDGVMVVVDESGDRLVAEGVAREKIAVVSNTPPLNRLAAQQADHEPGEPLRVVYLGLVEAQRGIETLLDAMAILRREQQAIHLVLYGDGVDAPHFRARASELGLTAPFVEFRGRVPNATALSALPAAHVGVIPHWSDESWNTTVPNKLFDYMAAGLAVVTSDAAPCERIIRTTGAGLVYHDRDAADLADKLRLLQDAAVRKQAAARGRAAIAATYNWERDSDRMMALLERAARR